MASKELFTGIKYQNHNHLQRLHVFSCPVYVLEPNLQDAKKLSKWKRINHRGIFLGLSKVHSTNVHLVLNTLTGHISSQYYLVFDDHFSTVYSDGEFGVDVWTLLVTSNPDENVDADDIVSTFEFESDDTLQLPSISNLPINLPQISNLLLLPSL